MKTSLKTDIVILGAGIGGYETFRTLAKLLKRKKLKKKITIIDKNNYFTFVPMLHEAAVGSVEPDHCVIPIRELIKGTPHQFIQTKVKHISPDTKQVTTDIGNIDYDICVVALGSGVKHFGVPGAKEYTQNVRTLQAALKTQQTLIQQLEDSTKKECWITIVGGGATGVEIAGQLTHFVKHSAKKYYPKKKLHIQLVQSNKVLVPNLHPKTQIAVKKRLKKNGVRIYTKKSVKKVTKNNVLIDGNKILKSDMVLWAAGVDQIANTFLDKKYTESGRVPVTTELYHKYNSSLYAVGDIAIYTSPKTQARAPQLGEVAHKQGRYVGRHIAHKLSGKKKQKPFILRSSGTIIAVGDGYAVGEIKGIHFHGFLTWIARRVVYIAFIPGILRKLRILIDWTLHMFGPSYTINTSEKQNKKLP